MQWITRMFTALLALVVVTTAGFAQSRSASTTASTSVVAHLTLTATQAMILGSPSGNFTGSVVTSSDAGAQAAHWTGTTDPGTSIQAQFTVLPSVLATSGGATVPFSCGTAAGVIGGGSAGGQFNPNLAGISGPISSSGQFFVTLGENGSPGPNANNCSADLTSASHGTYSATITLTATVQ